MGVDGFLACAPPVALSRSVDADPAGIGMMSTGEAYAVAYLPGRLDPRASELGHPSDVLGRHCSGWEKAGWDPRASGSLQ
jgi:hypothetical protein